MSKTDYYELLDVSPKASTMDIIHAYRQAKLAFQEDSPATYGLFSDVEMQEMRDQIDQAYHVLTDSEKRRAYDVERQQKSGESPQPSLNGSSKRSRQTGNDGLAHRIESAHRFPGSFLREIREQKQISLQSIAERTRISSQYLKAIENEDDSSFPALVYLKGYLRQYAREIGLDPERVVQGYPPLLPACSQPETTSD